MVTRTAAGKFAGKSEIAVRSVKDHIAYPNPFADYTTISYTLTEDVPVKLALYSLQGQQLEVLVDEKQVAGVHAVPLNGSSLAKGIYIYRLQTGNQVNFNKIIKQ